MKTWRKEGFSSQTPSKVERALTEDRGDVWILHLVWTPRPHLGHTSPPSFLPHRFQTPAGLDEEAQGMAWEEVAIWGRGPPSWNLDAPLEPCKSTMSWSKRTGQSQFKWVLDPPGGLGRPLALSASVSLSAKRSAIDMVGWERHFTSVVFCPTAYNHEENIRNLPSALEGHILKIYEQYSSNPLMLSKTRRTWEIITAKKSPRNIMVKCNVVSCMWFWNRIRGIK